MCPRKYLETTTLVASWVDVKCRETVVPRGVRRFLFFSPAPISVKLSSPPGAVRRLAAFHALPFMPAR